MQSPLDVLLSQHTSKGTPSMLLPNDAVDFSVLELSPKSLLFSPEWTRICYRQVLHNDRSLQSDFDGIVRVLLLLFSQPSPQVRSRVIRAIAVLLQTDLSLLGVPDIRDSVIERFNDVSISVREETVKLVGAYILQLRDGVNCGVKQEEAERMSELASSSGKKTAKSSKLSKSVEKKSPANADKTAAKTAAGSGSGVLVWDDYLNGLLVRLRDKGVSVRKSVVHILRDVLLHQPDHPR
jgi:hypothetical protein